MCGMVELGSRPTFHNGTVHAVSRVLVRGEEVDVFGCGWMWQKKRRKISEEGAGVCVRE